MQFKYADLAADRLVERWSPKQLETSILTHVEADCLYGTPDEARTVEGAVPVWALIGYLEATEGDLAAVATAYDLKVVTVEAAVGFYSLHRDEIHARIIANTDPQYVLVNS